MIRCEICGEPICDRRYIQIYDMPRRGVHKICLRKCLDTAFTNCIGTEDDNVGELIFDTIEFWMDEITPDSPDGGGHLPPMKEST